MHVRSTIAALTPRALLLLAVLAANSIAPSVAHAATKAPEFTHSSSAEWLNSKPLRLKQLRGKVVLVEFWAFECVNCRRTAPWLHSVQRRYADQGLVIVGVHTPELPQERSVENVHAAVAQQNITYAVMLDGDYSYWNALRNRYWPAFYVIDKKGRIAARAIGEMHAGQPRADDLERRIVELLAADAS